MVFGLRVNFYKSKIGGLGLKSREEKTFFQDLNYLDLPISGIKRRKKKHFLNDLLEKLRNKLTSWKGRLLSFPGEVCLIKSVISTLPLYYLSFFRVPKRIQTKLTKVQRDFLWAGNLWIRRQHG